MATECNRRNEDWLPRKPPQCFSLLLMLSVAISRGSCGCYRVNESDTTLEFAGQATFNKEHVVRRGSVTLSCEAVNFCHIQWYRRAHYDSTDMYLYPWNLGQLTEVNLQNINQTLRFIIADKDAKGFYTCVVSNGTHQINKTTQLAVDAIIWDGDPLPLQHKLCHNQTARASQNVTFFCPFYVGDEVSQTIVSWRRPNISLLEEEKDWSNSCGNSSDWLSIGEIEQISPFTAYHTRQIPEDETHMPNFTLYSPSIGSILEIVNVSEETYGLYCVIANNDGLWSRNVLMLSPLELSRPHNYQELTVVVVASSFLLVAVSFLLWKIVVLDIKLWYHSYLGDSEQNDGMLYDAYISYSWTDHDRHFVLNVIMPYLEGFGYRLFFPEIHTVPSNVLSEELRRAMELSRRCIMVITPSYVVSEFGKYEVELATDIMSSKLSKRIIPVFFGVSPHFDSSPLYGSEPSLAFSSSSSSPSLTSSSQGTSVSSDSQNGISYPSASGVSQGALRSVLSSCSTTSSTPSVFLSNPIKINFNLNPLLGQLVKVLKPLKTKRKEPSKLCNHKRFLKKLRLHMPKPPSRNRDVVMHQNEETVSHTSNLLENEVPPDGSGEDMAIKMEVYPRLYPVAPNIDAQGESNTEAWYPL